MKCTFCREPAVAKIVRPHTKGKRPAACLGCFRRFVGRDPVPDDPAPVDRPAVVEKAPVPMGEGEPLCDARRRLIGTPRSEKIVSALKIIADGFSVSTAAKKVGLKPATVEKGWLRWVVLPEWRELKAGKSDAAARLRLQDQVLELDAECQRLGAELADRDMEAEADAIVASPEFEDGAQLVAPPGDGS